MRDLYVWLDDRLQQLAVTQGEAHLRLRRDMENGFGEIRSQFADVFTQARTIGDRTLVIETERKIERREGVKVGAIYGAIAGALASAVIGALMRS